MKFELKVVDQDVTSGMIQVGWCVTPELIEYLKQKNYTDPAIVVVVKNKGACHEYSNGNESRHVFKLNDLIGYVDFKYPGETNIFAFMENYLPALHYLNVHRSRFETDILRNGDWSSIFNDITPDDRRSTDRKYIPNVSADILTIDIPKEAFAPEPHPWEKVWVNWLVKYEAEDQCHFRQRRLFAYTLQPVLFLLSFMVRILIMVLCVSFGGKPNWNFLSPFSKFEPPSAVAGSFIFSEAKFDVLGAAGRSGKPLGKLLLQAFMLAPFMPAIFIPCAICFFLWPLTTLATISAIFVTVLIVISIISSVRDVPAAKEEVADWLTKENFDLLTCQDGKPYSYNNLPSKKRTLKLKFQNLKSRICRPFAG